jgi:hypothetical protein
MLVTKADVTMNLVEGAGPRDSKGIDCMANPLHLYSNLGMCCQIRMGSWKFRARVELILNVRLDLSRRARRRRMAVVPVVGVGSAQTTTGYRSLMSHRWPHTGAALQHGCPNTQRELHYLWSLTPTTDVRASR